MICSGEKNQPTKQDTVRFLGYKHIFESEGAGIAHGLSLLSFLRKWSVFPQFNFPDISTHLCFNRTLLEKTTLLVFLKRPKSVKYILAVLIFMPLSSHFVDKNCIPYQNITNRNFIETASYTFQG